MGNYAVRDFMIRSVVTLRMGMTMEEAAKVLVANGISGAPVVDQEGNLKGVLSEKDCLRYLVRKEENPSLGGAVQDFMTLVVWTLDANTSLQGIGTIFLDTNFRRLPVVEAGRLVGLISIRDILAARMGMDPAHRNGNGDYLGL